jgi:general secretion pathway protein E
MGVEDFLLTSTINGVVAQRLVRTLCPHCREPYEALPGFAEKMQIVPLARAATPTLYRAKGCAQCNDTGYFGRSSIVEVLTMSDAIRARVLAHPDVGEVRRLAIAEGMRTMHLHGMKKVLAGQTSVEEVLRATRAV